MWKPHENEQKGNRQKAQIKRGRQIERKQEQKHGFSWGCLGTAGSPLAAESNGLQGREALHDFVIVTKISASHAAILVKCKPCARSFASVSERLFAHFTNKGGCHVSNCTKATPEAVALGKRFLKDLADKRQSTQRRAREASTVKSRRTFLQRKDNGTGTQAADKRFLRLIVATGQSYSLGESVYLRDFLDSIIAYPESKVRDGRILASTDLDADYDVVDTESKALLARNGRKGKESLHFLLVRCLFLFFVIDTHSAHCQIAKTIR